MYTPTHSLGVLQVWRAEVLAGKRMRRHGELGRLLVVREAMCVVPLDVITRRRRPAGSLHVVHQDPPAPITTRGAASIVRADSPGPAAA